MTKPKKNIVMLGCFDTKAEDFHYLHQCLYTYNVSITTINVGVLGTTTLFPVDFESDEVARQGKNNIDVLRSQKARGNALKIMGTGAAKILAKLVSQNKVDGVIGMGGGGGTFMTLLAMQAVSFGIPKMCISTLAAKDLADQMDSKDITLIPSIVDITGINRISSVIISQSAGALIGMVNASVLPTKKTAGSIAVSVFGNTTICVDACSKVLKSMNYEVLTFHAIGTGGKTMENLILDSQFDAILDITTTELADNLSDGICSAGPNRLEAASKMGIPQVVAPGCLDMVNFGTIDSVPKKYKKRQLFSWAPDVTLMRTNAEENKILGKQFAEKINKSTAPVTVLLPLGGISKISAEGEVFYQPNIDKILFDTIKENCHENITIIAVDYNINTPEFGNIATKELLKLLNKPTV